MDSYFVVRRAFRDTHGMHTTGSILDPVKVKNFKYRVQDGHIVEITEQNFEQWKYFFKARVGVELPVPKSKKQLPKEEKKQESTKVVAKAVVKKAD